MSERPRARHGLHRGDPLPLTLNANDDSVASDHLPALMTFANPFSAPFKLLSFSRTNQTVTLRWESMVNRFYNLETSSNLANWTILASNLLSTGSNLDFSTNNLADPVKFLRVRRLP